MRLFETEVDGDITRQWFADEKGTAIVKKTQDVNPSLFRARQIRDAGAHGKDGRHIASIPVTILEEIKRTLGYDFLKKEDLPKVMAIIQRDYSMFTTGKM